MDYLKVYGNDYDTIDGTGVRDYIHEIDLAEGHLNALHYINDTNGIHVFNIGTGNGYSVLEMLKAFEMACDKTIPYQIAPRRPGDIATCYADVTKANEILHWEAQRDIQQMCLDHWNFQ